MSEPTQSHFARYQLVELAAPGSDTFVDGPFGSSLKSHEYVDSGVRLIQLQNIGEGDWRDENKRFITPRKFKTLERHGALPGDIAIAKMADPVARACLVPAVSEQFVVVADCIRLRLDESRFDAGYVVRAINSPYTRREAERKAIGSTRVRINLSVLKTVGCLAPDLPVQKKITRVLDTIDTAIHKTEVIIAKLKAIKQGLLHDLLTRGVDANGELRPSHAEAPHLYQDSPLGWIPKEWEQTNFGARVGLLGGYGFPERFQSHAEGEMPFFKVSDQSSLGNERELRFANHYVSRDRARKQGWRPLPKDGVAFAKVGAALLLNRRRILAQDSLVDNNMMVAIAVDSLSSRWLYWFLQTVDFGLFVQPGALPSINQGQLSALSVAFPDVEEQDAIAARLDQIDMKAETEQGELRKLVKLKTGLMDDLLTGRVRVTPLLTEATQRQGGA